MIQMKSVFLKYASMKFFWSPIQGIIKENPQYKVALHIDDTVEEQQLTIQRK